MSNKYRSQYPDWILYSLKYGFREPQTVRLYPHKQIIFRRYYCNQSTSVDLIDDILTCHSLESFNCMVIVKLKILDCSANCLVQTYLHFCTTSATKSLCDTLEISVRCDLWVGNCRKTVATIIRENVLWWFIVSVVIVFMFYCILRLSYLERSLGGLTELCIWSTSLLYETWQSDWTRVVSSCEIIMKVGNRSEASRCEQAAA